ncbi:MAG: efflux RND transporter periplasmic adaptor subunit [Sandaracinus sp.]|nr:efflux RND transporter periplasmic adaptor subunit [Sandaracinus sp.]
MTRRSAVLSLSLSFALACGQSATPTPVDLEGAAPSSPTPWARVRPARDTTLVTTLGRVHGVGAAAGTAITAPFATRVRRVHVAPGDAVEAGAPLLEVDAPELALAAAERSGATAEGAVVGARLQTLRTLASEGLARADQVHETARDAAAVRTRAATAEAQLRAAGISARDRATLARTGSLVLRAPRAGRVLRLEVREGDPVPGDRPLVVLAGEGAVRVEGRFSGTYPEGATPVLRTDRGDVPLRVVGEPLADPETGLRVVFFEPIGPTTLREGERFPLALVGSLDEDGATFEVPSSALHALAGDPRRAEVVRRSDGEHVSVEVLRVDGASALVRGALTVEDEVAVEPSQVLGLGEGEAE